MQLDRSPTTGISIMRSINQIYPRFRRRSTRQSWTISMENCNWLRNPVAQCKGLTFGLKPGSFRAESYGYFSALLFLQAYTEYYSITIDIDIIHDFLYDSESLLNRIQRTITRSWVNTSHCLASNYNLLESGIVDILATIGISFNYLHVKSHQDDATDIHLLPWTAQMNAHVDTLATDCLNNYSEPSKLVTFIPASKASLTINRETIT